MLLSKGQMVALSYLIHRTLRRQNSCLPLLGAGGRISVNQCFVSHTKLGLAESNNAV